jgi:dTDP-4-dehydrorhamnose 3,5-epimerase-like enzyme
MQIAVNNCKLIDVCTIDEKDRGILSFFEVGKHIDFPVKRIYWIYNVGKNIKRGGHAHKNTVQVLFCLQGNINIYIDDGVNNMNIVLDKPNQGLLISPMIWHDMKGFSCDTIILVFASEHYDENDYIRNYDEFLKLAGKKE